jgi:hypothetical protein
MYDKLMEEELVTAGFPKSSKTNHWNFAFDLEAETLYNIYLQTYY